MRSKGSVLLFTALLGGAALCGFGCSPSSPAEDDGTTANPDSPGTTRSQPNVLFVVYDARRRDDFSFGPFGNRRNDTPFLAAFQQDAAYFREAVSPGCWTVPVHASMFSGLSVDDLGIDYYTESFSSFSTEFRSLAEILQASGYQTIAYADHPYFYHKDRETSLMRGFELFSVIRDFRKFACNTNVGTDDGQVRLRSPFSGLETPFQTLEEEIRRFNRGELRIDLEEEADLDPQSGVYLARLDDLFADSDYFRQRYAEEFDRYVFREDETRPFFLFLNLHMCTIAFPDHGLWDRWLMRTAMANAQAKGETLSITRRDRDAESWALRNLESLGVSPGLWADGTVDASETLKQFKHVFDNRFYDACFQGIWAYLEVRGLTDDTATIVCSDHGLSFREQGEQLYYHGGARPTEPLVRVPLVVRFPSSSDLPRLHGVYEQKVSLTDVFRTIVDLALGPGVFERELPIRGRSLVERIAAEDFDETVFSESTLKPNSYDVLPGVAGPSRAIYRGDEKLVFAPTLFGVPKDWPHTSELPEDRQVEGSLLLYYDLEADPHERKNLAQADPASVERLVERWREVETHAVRREETPEWDEEALETLRALGYIE